MNKTNPVCCVVSDATACEFAYAINQGCEITAKALVVEDFMSEEEYSSVTLIDNDYVDLISEIDDEMASMTAVIVYNVPQTITAETTFEWMEAGFKGYILKNADMLHVTRAIVTCKEGGLWYARDVLQKGLKQNQWILNSEQQHVALSVFENIVFRLIKSGFSNREIAYVLDINYDDVNEVTRTVLLKTGHQNKLSLATRNH